MMTKDKYIDLIYAWGFYPALETLAFLEEKEMFNECAKLKAAMEEVRCKRFQLSTKTDELSRNNVLEYVLRDRPNDIIRNNMWYYCQEFRNEVLKEIGK